MEKKYSKGKTVAWLGVCMALLMVMFLVVLFWENQRMPIIDISDCDTSSTENITYKIERVVCKTYYISIKGYAYERGKSIDFADTNVLAYDSNRQVYYLLPTENRKDTDITEKLGDGYNYDYSRFHSVAMRKKFPKGCQLFIQYKNNGENILLPTDVVLD